MSRYFKFNQPYWGAVGAGLFIKCPSTGRFLWVLRSEFVSEPNTWNAPGGKLEEGENPRQTAIREFCEETGYEDLIEVSTKPFSIYCDGDFSYFYFYGEVKEEFTPALDWENSDWVWAKKCPKPKHFGVKALKQF